MAQVVLSAVIMAHPARAEAAELLRKQYPELGVRVVFDPDPTGPRSTLRTARLAWGAVAPGASHHLILQDDVLLCDDFSGQLAAAVRSRPEDPLFLYTDWGTRCAQLLRLAALREANWAEAIDEYLPAQAMVLPVELARQLVQYVDERPGLEPDDALVLRSFLADTGRRGYVCVPNLVEHGHLPSLLSHDVLMGARQSVCFGPAGPAEPNGPAVPMPWSGNGLSGATLVPDFAAGRARCWTRPDGGADDWSAVSAYRWLLSRGCALPELSRDFQAAAAVVGVGPVSAATLSTAVLLQLWLSGLVYGIVLGSDGALDGDAVVGAMQRPLAARCLSTLVGGGLREIVAEARIPQLSVELTPLFRHAVGQGVTQYGDRR